VLDSEEYGNYWIQFDEICVVETWLEVIVKLERSIIAEKHGVLTFVVLGKYMYLVMLRHWGITFRCMFDLQQQTMSTPGNHVS